MKLPQQQRKWFVFFVLTGIIVSYTACNLKTKNNISEQSKPAAQLKLQWCYTETTIHDTIKCSNPISGIRIAIAATNLTDETITFIIDNNVNTRLSSNFSLVTQIDSNEYDTLKLACSNNNPVQIPAGETDTIGLVLASWDFDPASAYYAQIPAANEQFCINSRLFYFLPGDTAKPDQSVEIKKTTQYYFSVKKDFCLNVKRNSF